MADSPKTPPSETPEPKATDEAGADSAPLDWTSTRKRKQPFADDGKTPIERFLEQQKNAPPESDEDRRLREYKELQSRKEHLHFRQSFENRMARFSNDAEVSPIVKPASHPRKVFGGIVLAFIVLIFCFATAYQQAGVVDVLLAHLLIVAGWIGFMLSIGFADYYLPLPRRKKIKIWIIVGCASLLFSAAVDWYMVHLKHKQIAEESKPTNPR
ncbi:MAG: hypothetical protein QOH41_1156 [Blastocatellia bacterium]|jgi:uncharacterized membrane protein YcjF (UPF0283 family)|nr:hypothetical protein [Blastocatellia bacterium]